MKILSWNVRGLGGLEKRRKVRFVVGSCDPDVVILHESKKEVVICCLVRWTLGMSLSEWTGIPSVGAVGGILLAWNPLSVDKVDEFIGQYSISFGLKDIQRGHIWMFTLCMVPLRRFLEKSFGWS